MDQLAKLHEWIESHLGELICQPQGYMRHRYISLGCHYGSGGRTYFWDAFFTALRFYHSGLAEPVLGTLECYLDHLKTNCPADEKGQVYRVLAPYGPMVLATNEQIQPFLCQFA